MSSPTEDTPQTVKKPRMTGKEYYQANKERMRAYGRKTRELHPDSKGSNTPEYRKKYFADPERRFKRAAREKLKQAVRKGSMTRGICEVEGCEIIGQGHHDDYNKPYEVRWLCRDHHENLHHKGDPND